MFEQQCCGGHIYTGQIRMLRLMCVVGSNCLVPLTLSAMYDIANSKYSEFGIHTLRMIMPAFNYMLKIDVCLHGMFTL